MSTEVLTLGAKKQSLLCAFLIIQLVFKLKFTNKMQKDTVMSGGSCIDQTLECNIIYIAHRRYQHGKIML